MTAYETRCDLADKIDWEGGYDEFFTEYGMLPEDAPDDEVYAAVDLINRESVGFLNAIEALRELLPEPGGDC